MAAHVDQQIQVGIRHPLSIPIHKEHHSIPIANQNYNDPSYYQNQLQFNMQTPYSITSLAANFTKPCPLIIEKVPPTTLGPHDVPSVPISSVPSSPASSISSGRLHLAVQLAKMDAKRIKECREQQIQKEDVSPHKDVKGQSSSKVMQSHSVQKSQNTRRQASRHAGKVFQNQNKLIQMNKKERDGKRSLHSYHVYPNFDESPDHSDAIDKQTKEIRRLEKQIHKYLGKLDELINKGQEVIQKKDKRLFVKKDDVSHLSDDDTDPRQFERADEQATRSARVLYMIERQIRELDDELRKKGKNVRRGRKSQTLSRLAAAQRATVRALQMLINSAPLQPKGSHHYPHMYQELTSLIQQLSLLSIQLESDSDVLLFDKKAKVRTHDEDFLRRRSTQNPRAVFKEEGTPDYVQHENSLEKRSAFNRESTRNQPKIQQPSLGNVSPVKKIGPDDSALTIDPTPERSETLRAGLQALLRMKQEQKTAPTTSTSDPPVATKKKAVLLPSSLQAKRRKANLLVQRTIKPPTDTAHFTKATTASRLKRVNKQNKTTGKGDDIRDSEKDVGANTTDRKRNEGASEAAPHKVTRFNEELQEREIQRQMWLENESKRKLREVMEIPQKLVSEAEEAIKTKLKPLLDQAQVVVESTKTKPIQERFVDLASKVTMKENEALSEMILDDLLVDTAEECQRLHEESDVESQVGDLRDSSTLDNILQKLEQFEKEEESIRRRLTHVSYDDPREYRHMSINERKTPEIKPTNGSGDGPHPIVIQSTSSKAKHPAPSREIPTFSTVKGEMTQDQGVPHNRCISYGPPPTSSRIPLDNFSTHLSLSSKTQQGILTYQQKYAAYLKGTDSHSQGDFDPWRAVEQISDEIFDEVVKEVADEFCGACDAVTELVFQSEFVKD